MTDIELLLAMYSQQVSRSEHYENLRTSAANHVLVLGGIIGAIAGIDGAVSAVDGWLGLLLIVLGIYGFSAATFHSARAARHGKHAEEFRNAIDRLQPSARINEIRNRVPRERTQINDTWALLNGALILVGASLVVLVALTP